MALRLLPITSILPHMQLSKDTTHRGVLVSSVEYLVTTTLYDLVDSLEGSYHQGDIPPPIVGNLEGDG